MKCQKYVATVLIVAILLGTVTVKSGITVYAQNDIGDEYTVSYDGYTYLYKFNEYGARVFTGMYYNDEYYSYVIDDTGIIVGMADSAGKQIVKYEYDDCGVISFVFSWEGEWRIANENAEFIGNINRILNEGMEYDRETGYYLIYGRPYDPKTKAFVDGIYKPELYQENNPYLNITEGEAGISLLGYEVNEEAAELWCAELMQEETHGTQIRYASNWYGNLSTVEILSRLIYCENSAYVNEQCGVARVIINRVNSSQFPNDVRGVITASGQFSSIRGGSGATQNARQPDTSSKMWEWATFYACLMLTTMDESEWNIIVGKPIGSQLYFYSYTTAKNNSVFRDYNGAIQIKVDGNWVNISDVQVIDYGTYTSAETLLNLKGIGPWERNIFYNIK